MRVTIIPDDGFVSVDGLGFVALDLSFMPSEIHAVQWYHNEGDVEYRDARGRSTRNETITDLTLYAQALNVWRAAKAQAEVEAAQTTQAEPNAG